jgi:hypothetical protein
MVCALKSAREREQVSDDERKGQKGKRAKENFDGPGIEVVTLL